ncbi:MAG: pseudouridine synthase [Gammaproteobacteria bacterium]|nr:pseudouridine synthase [Gammaproteobacteria bacterium]
MTTTPAPSTLRLPPGPWTTVFECLCSHFPQVTPEQWSRRFEDGRVLDASHRPLSADHAYRVGLTVHYFRQVDDEPRIPFTEALLHVDEHIVVADKPHFLPVTPAGRFVEQTLLARLVERLGNRDLVPLHRIDRGTAGLVMFSANRATRSVYQALFRTGSVRKVYEAIATPLPALALPHRRASRIVRSEPFFRMTEAPGPPNAQTLVEAMDVLSVDHGAARARYRLRLETGRKHQLRVHMAALGAAIEGDTLYPEIDSSLLPHPRAAGDWRAPADDFSRPLRLLARELSFEDPISGSHRHFESLLRLE